MPSKSTAVLLVIITTLLTTSAQFFFKEGASRLPEILLNWPLVFGVFCYGLGAALLIYALKGGEVSILYPITASSYVWVTFIAWYFLAESFSAMKGIGILCILAGVILLGFAAQKTVQYVEPV